MAQPYDLTQLDSSTFEHMINFLALKVLGAGTTGFAPGPDGGRDGYFKGEAAYPSAVERWTGNWYIQSKFHKPSMSKNPNNWLFDEVKKEIEAFSEPHTRRELPDIWILATNIEPSGVSKTGAYDRIQKLIKENFGDSVKFDIWGGRRVLDFLADQPNVASYYGHFLTPGQVLTTLQESLLDSSAQAEAIITHFVVSNFNEQIYTKLEQAGSNSDTRPKIHDLFIDLPFKGESQLNGLVFESMIHSAANNHRISAWNDFGPSWQAWARNPIRSRVTVIKGGPGQGKSTIGQYFAQIQRAALILEEGGPNVTPAVRVICQELKSRAVNDGYWPGTPRIPITIELKDFAKWYGSRTDFEPTGILRYISDRIRAKMGEEVLVGTLKRAIQKNSWFITFDGLDEVPNDVKDDVANEIIEFTNELIPSLNSDILILCTTRPQGYSGQFEKLEAAEVTLSNLPPTTALKCAAAVVTFGRSPEESENSISALEAAMASEQVRDLMTTPLQAHIMAVLVRDGGRPPEKRWQLFENFYQVMKKRETLKGFGNQNVAKLLRESETLLKAIHSRLGVSLHAKAENSSGAETTLAKNDFKNLAIKTTEMLIEENVSGIVDTLMEATTERLVFVNTPDDNESVRFDIRQLQEFFAGEFIYTGVDLKELQSRIEIIGSDSHWREVMHFMLSALVVANRTIELTVAINALASLDTSLDCHDVRILKHRTAAGAILSLRLLNEGVLEQDRRVRSQFSSCLKPIFASLDPEVIWTLSSISHSNSHAWVLGTMVDALMDLSESEQIGAAVALARKLPDHHPRSKEVSAKIMNSSDSYLEFIYELNTDDEYPFSRDEGEPSEISDWFLFGTIQLLADWGTVMCKHSNINLEKVIGFLHTHKNRALEMINMQYEHGESRYLKAIILNDDPAPDSLTKSISGFVALPYKSNWKTNTLPDLLNFEHNNPTNRPLFTTLNSIINFSRDKSLHSFIELIDALRPIQNYPRAIPTYIRALVPINFDNPDFSEELDFHSRISQSDLRKLLKTGSAMGRTTPALNKLVGLSDFRISSWQAACKKMPLLAIEIWFSREIFIGDKENDDPAYAQEILKIANQTPSLLARHVLAWGKLFEKFPDKQDKLLKTFSAVPFSAHTSYIESYSIFPFQLSMPRDLLILPQMAEALVQMQSTGFRRGSNRMEHRSVKNVDEATLLSYGISSEILLNTIRDIDIDLSIRRAALSIYITHDFNNNDRPQSIFFDELQSIFMNTLPGSPNWYPISGIIFCDKNLDLSNHLTAKFMGNILNIYRDNYAVSDAGQSLISRWRERSAAPVNSNSALEPWLNYNIG